MGTAEQVAESLLAYHQAGADAFIIRGFVAILSTLYPEPDFLATTGTIRGAISMVNWFWDERTEDLLLALSAAVGLISLLWGYRTRHGHRRCIVTFAAGLSFLVAARFMFHTDGLAVAAAASGAVLISAAHTLNLKLCRACPDCRDHRD